MPSSSEHSHDGSIASVVRHEDEIDRKMNSAKALKSLLAQGRLLISLVKDYFTGQYREVPYWVVGAAALALVYVLSPVDVIPDVFLGVGYLDDAVVLSFCLKLVQTELDKYKEWKEAKEKTVNV